MTKWNPWNDIVGCGFVSNSFLCFKSLLFHVSVILGLVGISLSAVSFRLGKVWAVGSQAVKMFCFWRQNTVLVETSSPGHKFSWNIRPLTFTSHPLSVINLKQTILSLMKSDAKFPNWQDRERGSHFINHCRICQRVHAHLGSFCWTCIFHMLCLSLACNIVEVSLGCAHGSVRPLLPHIPVLLLSPAQLPMWRNCANILLTSCFQIQFKLLFKLLKVLSCIPCECQLFWWLQLLGHLGHPGFFLQNN